MSVEKNLSLYTAKLKNALNENRDAVAEELVKKARSKAPVVTGQLRDSITIIRVFSNLEVGPTVNYAPYVEFGTSKMEAQPFLQPATEEIRATLIAKSSARIQKALKNVL